MIEAINLTKRFDDIKAVDHINAVIREGSVFGLIGTNGAGKSTLLKVIAGVFKPTEGSVTKHGKMVRFWNWVQDLINSIQERKIFIFTEQCLDIPKNLLMRSMMRS